MATDEEKAHALEDLLKDSLHTLESLNELQRLQSLDSETQEKELSPEPSAKSAEKKAAPEKSAARPPVSQEEASLLDRIGEFTGSAFRFARRTTDTSLKVGRALMRSQDQLRVMLAAGESLRDVREVAGLTLNELSEALNLNDKTLLEAVENGTATLSFELILRLAALFARNDPIPFVLRYSRTYSPETWKILNDWGVGRLPLQFERERQFINIFRSQDSARKLSDEGFAKVLEFTRSSFEMSLHFIAEQEAALEKAKSELKADHHATKKSASDKDKGTKPQAKKERRGKSASSGKTAD